MRLSGFVVVLASGMMQSGLSAADATRAVDPAQRNEAFAPAATVQPRKKELPRAEAVQAKRVEPPSLEKKTSVLGGKRAAVDVTETHAKNVREKKSERPRAEPAPRSAFDHRAAEIATAADKKTPPLVAKYQDSLAAASATNMARFPAVDRATTAKINRFVFRRNAPDPDAPSTAGAAPAAGGSPVTNRRTP